MFLLLWCVGCKRLGAQFCELIIEFLLSRAVAIDLQSVATIDLPSLVFGVVFEHQK